MIHPVNIFLHKIISDKSNLFTLHFLCTGYIYHIRNFNHLFMIDISLKKEEISSELPLNTSY